MQFGIIYALAAIGFASAYRWLLLSAPPSLSRAMVKALAVGALALAVLVEDGPLLLVAGLLLCALGDFFLALSEKWLRAGMAAFAAGHVSYIALIVLAGGGPGLDVLRVMLQVLVALSGIGALIWIWPGATGLRKEVAAYAFLVTLMTFLAIGLPGALVIAGLGAVLFFLSDGLVAAELFRLPKNAPERRWTGPALWALYFWGQFFIAFGFLARPG